MKKAIENIRNFFNELQDSSEERKRRWTRGLTVVIAIIFISGWIGYAGSSLARDIRPLYGDDEFSPSRSTNASNERASMIESVYSGAVTIGRGVIAIGQKVSNSFRSPKEYIIE